MPSRSTRLAAAEDIERISEIHVASWRAAYTGLVADEALEDRTVNKRMKQWKEFFDDPEHPHRRLYVIEEDGEIAGFAFAGPSEDEDLDPESSFEIHSLYLDPARRRSGLGGALLEHVLDDFWARGFRLATLYVLIGNEPAKRFYEGRGWVEEPDVIDECLGDGTSAPQTRFRLSLASGA